MSQNVLVVDDDDLIRRAIALELRQRFNVYEAGSPEEALAVLERVEVVAVVSDLVMDGAGDAGIVLLEKIRLRAPAVIRLLISGTLAAQLGSLKPEVAHACMAKPWRAGEVLATIERLLG